MYAKNDPINMHDNSGFRAMRDDGDISSGDGTSAPPPPPSKSSGSKKSSGGSKNSIIDNISAVVTSDEGGVVGSIADAAIGFGIGKLVSSVAKPIDYLFSTPKIATVAAGVCAVGVVGAISLGFNIRDDLKNSNGWDTVGRIGFDVLGTAATIGIGMALGSYLAPTLAGVAVGTAAAVVVGYSIGKITGWIKNKWF